MPYNHPIPDAPIAPAMLPRVTAENLTLQDVLILTQPGNNPGQKNKGLELGALFDASFAAQAYAAGAAPKFYEFAYEGPLPRTGVAPDQPGSNAVGTQIVQLTIPFKHQAIFWLDGYSDRATSFASATGDYVTSYTYGLRLTARSFWSPNDGANHDLFFPCMTGRRGDPTDTQGNVSYEPEIQFPDPTTGAPGALHIPYSARGQWWLHNPAHEEGASSTATKLLSLFAFGGASNNPYQAEDPASYHLNIHVLVFPDHKYDFPAG